MSESKPNAREIFLTAIEQYSSEEWDAYLDEACAGDGQLRSQIEKLLRAHQDLGTFTEDVSYPATSAPLAMEQPGDTIGRYKLLQQIGEGGMGAVYMAEQTKPVERRVALKIIKAGMDTRNVIGRFEAERQALAMMDHPNIAKVLDAGPTDTGKPYFVMELVKGVPVTKYCDDRQLTLRERLGLFVPICQAVQHAHQKGIIHRDIKPSNVLVAEYDDRAVPKIIDFGVAKAIEQRLTEKTMFTEFGQIVGTFEYMSPEQAKLNQLDIDTRTDIYSLGVLLYELLAGETPFDSARLRAAAFDELLRIIREEDPPKPSFRLSTSESLPSIAAKRHIEPNKLSTLVRGELDWIVMKALEKNRARRYETATGFAQDIQRYLNDEPVVACPPSAVYRFKKFARRNKTWLAVATAATLVLVVSATAALVAADRFRTLAWRNAELALQKQGALDTAKRSQAEAESAREEEVKLRKQAEQQTQIANAALFETYLSQANASRSSRRPGQRIKSLDALNKAADLMSRLGMGAENRLKLRNEAIAAMGLIDLSEYMLFQQRQDDWFVTFDLQRKLYASADASGHLSLWRLPDHQRISQLPIQSRSRERAPRKFTAGGRFLVGVDRTHVWAWDVAREEFVLRVEVGTPPHPDALSTQGELLAVVAEEGSVRLFDLLAANEILSLPTEATSVSLSPDGLQAAVTVDGDAGVQIWDCTTGNLLHELMIPEANSTAWSPDSRLLACGVDARYRIVVWNLATDELCSELVGHQNAGLNFCFNHDGSILASASWDASARLWDPLSAQELLRTSGQRCELHGADDVLALADGMKSHLWQLIGSEECQTIRACGNREELLFRYCDFWWGGPVIACVRGDGLRVINLRTKQNVAFAPIGVTESVIFHQNTTSLITSGVAGVYQWPISVAEDGKAWCIGPPRKLIDTLDEYPGGAYLTQNHDGTRLAAVVDEDSAVVFSLDSDNDRVRLEGHRGIRNLAISNDGRWVVTGTKADKGVKVWCGETGRMIHDLWPDCLAGHVSFSPDGSLIAVCNLTELRIFETQSWRLLRSASWEFTGHRQSWSPDGRLIAISVLPGEARLVDSRTGAEFATITSPNLAGNIEAFSFSPSGGRLAIAYRNAVEVWDLRRVRRQLAEMNLDWDLPAIPPEAPSSPLPDEIEFDLGTLASVLSKDRRD